MGALNFFNIDTHLNYAFKRVIFEWIIKACNLRELKTNFHKFYGLKAYPYKKKKNEGVQH